MLKGIRRTKGTAQTRKAPLLVNQLRTAIAGSRQDLLGLRDRALLFAGFRGTFRRSELVALDVADVAFTDDGLVVTIRRSKTDQEGEGRKIWVPFGSKAATCPVRALRAWLDAARHSERFIVPAREPARQTWNGASFQSRGGHRGEARGRAGRPRP